MAQHIKWLVVIYTVINIRVSQQIIDQLNVFTMTVSVTLCSVDLATTSEVEGRHNIVHNITIILSFCETDLKMAVAIQLLMWELGYFNNSLTIQQRKNVYLRSWYKIFHKIMHSLDYGFVPHI
jgi:hypothetical protein